MQYHSKMLLKEQDFCNPTIGVHCGFSRNGKPVKKIYFTVLILFSFLFWAKPILFAQSDTVIDALLAQKKASFGKSVYLILAASGLIPEDASEDQAISLIRDKGWKILKKSKAEPINLGEFSYLTMKAFEMKGGLMYTVFPGPRYASRELSYLGVISGSFAMFRYLRSQYSNSSFSNRGRFKALSG
ncbi:MAG: hypothetical protein AB1798_13475 [Spirochaetota bacterium]